MNEQRSVAYDFAKAALVPFALFLLALALHVIPFLSGHDHPLGYDTGFYRRYLTQPTVSFPNAPVPGLGSDAIVPRVLFDALRFVHIPTDYILYGTYLLWFALLPLLVFLFLKPRAGYTAALLAALFVIVSPLQYIAFWYFFWKNAWALCLLFAAFLCVDRRWLYPLIFFDITIALSHKTTAILYLATLAMYFLIERAHRKVTVLHALITAACFLLVSFSQIGSALSYAPRAMFIDWSTYLGLSASFVLLILARPRFFRSMHIPKILIAFTITGLLFPILHIPFYERVFIFTDVALAILAGCALADFIAHFKIEMFDRRMIISTLIVCIAIGTLAGSLRTQMRAYIPLMTNANVNQIAQVGALVPPEATILTTSDEASWYEGWTLSHIAAPGMLRDHHNLNEWIDFWSATSTADKISFLSELPHPLYIATLSELPDLLGTTTVPCIEYVAPNLYFDACHAKNTPEPREYGNLL